MALRDTKFVRKSQGFSGDAGQRVLSEADPYAFGVGATVLGELTPHPIEDEDIGGEFLLRVRDPGTGSRTGADRD